MKNKRWLFKGLTICFFADDEGGEGDGGGAGGNEGDAGTTFVGGESGGEGGEFLISDVMNDDGTFKEGWRDKSLDEENRGQGIYDRIKDFKGVLKSLGNQERAISKKGIIPLGENPTDEEVATFRQQMGVPKEPAGYEFKVPESLQQYYSDDVIEATKQELHALNIPTSTFHKLMEMDANRIMRSVQARQEELQRAELEAEIQINAEFGNKKMQKLHAANLGINEVTKDWSPEDKLALFGTEEEPAGINSPEFASIKPLFLRFMSTIGGYFSEDGGLRLAQLADPETIESQISAINDQLTEDLRRSDKKKYNELLAQKDALYAKRYPNRES